VARILTERMRELLGRPIIVENRPGNGGQVPIGFGSLTELIEHQRLVQVDRGAVADHDRAAAPPPASRRSSWRRSTASPVCRAQTGPRRRLGSSIS